MNYTKRYLLLQIIGFLQTDAKDTLLISDKDCIFDDTNTTVHDIKQGRFTDRLPSKKYDLIILACSFHTLTQSEQTKYKKYLLKFNKYLLLISPDAAAVSLPDKPKAYINISNTEVMRHYSVFRNLIKNHAELKSAQQTIIQKIHDGYLVLGAVEPVNRDQQYDALLMTATEELKDSFTHYFESQKNPRALEDFYRNTLTIYAQGLDKRSVRFQKNITFLGSIAASTVQGITSSISVAGKRLTRYIQISLQNKKEKHPQSNEKKVVRVHKPFPILVPLRKYMVKHLHNLQIGLYIARYVQQIKPLTYDEFSRKSVPVIASIKQKRERQKMTATATISILMVVDDIDEIWLNKSVRTVKDQVYKNWELIIVDNCSPRTYLKSYLSSLTDPRIKTHFYNSKKTYAECLATAFKISKGDFIAILEEGDEIELHTLFTIAKQVLQDKKIDLVYTDNDQINEQGKHVLPFFKPEWDKVLVCSYPFAKNFLVVKKELIERLDAFKSFNSNDPVWDLLLRTRDATTNIKHIPQILYHKRARPIHKLSTSIVPQPDVLKSYYAREGVGMEIKNSDFGGSFYTIFKDSSNKKVTAIVIGNNDKVPAVLESLKNQPIETHLLTTRPHTITDTPSLFIHAIGKTPIGAALNSIILKTDSPYILLLDSRIVLPRHDFLDIMISAAHFGSIVGTKVVDPEDIIQNSIYIKNTRSIISSLYEGTIDHHQFAVSVQRACTAVSKRCMLFKRSLFDTVQFDDQYQTSYLDIDVCLAAGKQGLPTIFAPDAKVMTLFPYSKESFNDEDTAYFIHKWKKELLYPDPYIPRMLLQMKV